MIKAGAIFDRILGVLIALGCVIFMATLLFINVSVVMRYVFHSPIAWAVEVSEFPLVVVVGLGLAWLLKEEGHVKVDIILNWLKPRPQALVNVITSLLCVVGLLVFSWYGLQDTLFHLKTGTRELGIIRFPTVFLLISLLIGFLLFSIQFMRRSYGFLQSWRAGKMGGHYG